MGAGQWCGSKMYDLGQYAQYLPAEQFLSLADRGYGRRICFRQLRAKDERVRRP